jgi:hypothetical protein
MGMVDGVGVQDGDDGWGRRTRCVWWLGIRGKDRDSVWAKRTRWGQWMWCANKSGVGGWEEDKMG